MITAAQCLAAGGGWTADQIQLSYRIAKGLRNVLREQTGLAHETNMNKLIEAAGLDADALYERLRSDPSRNRP